MKKMLLFGAACAMLMFVGGCSHYYKVREPGSDKVYYTDDLDNEGGGAILFHDVVTHQEIRLQNSEVIRITKDEYLANIHGR
jgi:hypothetical protein